MNFVQSRGPMFHRSGLGSAVSIEETVLEMSDERGNKYCRKAKLAGIYPSRSYNGTRCLLNSLSPEIDTYCHSNICWSHTLRHSRYNLRVHTLPVCLPLRALQDTSSVTTVRTWGLENLERGSMEEVTPSRLLRHAGCTRDKRI